MSEEGFEHFRKLVLEDVTLQKQLQNISDQKMFLNRVVELGQERGCHFTAAEVENAQRAWRRAWFERGIWG